MLIITAIKVAMWLSIRGRQEPNILLFIQKMKMADSPTHLSDQLEYVGDVLPYSLRNAKNVWIQRVTNNQCEEYYQKKSKM